MVIFAFSLFRFYFYCDMSFTFVTYTFALKMPKAIFEETQFQYIVHQI